MNGERQHLVPTYTRVWQYPWMLRGIGEFTFWRPVQGRAVVAFFVTMALLGLILRRLGIHLALVPGALVYLGIPGLLGRAATLAPLRGKRLDKWLVDNATYQAAPKRFDRFEATPAPTIYEIGGDK